MKTFFDAPVVRQRARCLEMKLALVLLLLTLVGAAQAQFNYVVTNGSVTITGYTGPGGAATIPDSINGLPVTSIGDSAFAGCTNLAGGLWSALATNALTGGWSDFADTHWRDYPARWYRVRAL